MHSVARSKSTVRRLASQLRLSLNKAQGSLANHDSRTAANAKASNNITQNNTRQNTNNTALSNVSAGKVIKTPSDILSCATSF